LQPERKGEGGESFRCQKSEIILTFVCGGILHQRLNIGWETDSEQVPCGKDQKALKRELKELEVVEREAIHFIERTKGVGGSGQ